MSEIDPNEAYVRSKNGAVQGRQTIRTDGTPLYLFCVGGEIGGRVIDADLYDDLFRRSNGKIPAEIDIRCPRCGEYLRIDGTKKTILVHYLDKPRHFRHPVDGKPVVQVARVEIEEPLVCSGLESGGKGRCGFRMKIKDNRVAKA